MAYIPKFRASNLREQETEERYGRRELHESHKMLGSAF